MPPQSLGKWLVLAGILLVALGLLVLGLGRLGLFRLPGDLEFDGRFGKFHFPLASCLLLSALLTLAMWLIQWFRR